MKYKVSQNFGRGVEFMQSFTSKKKALSFAKFVCDSYVDNFIKKNPGVEFDICKSYSERSNPYFFMQEFGLRVLRNGFYFFRIYILCDD